LTPLDLPKIGADKPITGYTGLKRKEIGTQPGLQWHAPHARVKAATAARASEVERRGAAHWLRINRILEELRWQGGKTPHRIPTSSC